MLRSRTLCMESFLPSRTVILRPIQFLIQVCLPTLSLDISGVVLIGRMALKRLHAGVSNPISTLLLIGSVDRPEDNCPSGKELLHRCHFFIRGLTLLFDWS